MKPNGQLAATIILFTLCLFSIIGAGAIDGIQFEVESITGKVYRDGLLHITQTLIVDDLLPKIDIPLLSSSVENLIILDENMMTIDYRQNAANLTVFTLGASRISIEYDTIALTNKEANIWTLILNNPYNISVILPSNSTIVYLSQVPTTIDTTDNELCLFLYPSQWEISYIVPLLQEDTNNNFSWVGFPFEYSILIAIAASTIIILAVFVIRRRKISVNKIVKPHSQLTKEDKAVIEFLAEKEGKAFEAEIRERFPDMPRTSLWRLVRRLERLEIVEVNKIGLENQVQLKK